MLRSPAVPATPAAAAVATARCSFSPPVFTVDTSRTFSGLLDQLDPKKSGVTAPGKLDVRTETVRDGPNWRLCVTGVTSVVHSQSWLAIGEQEPTIVNSTEANFCEQVRDLHQVSDRATGSHWYMQAATKKHELQHVEEWKKGFIKDWPAVQAAIESIHLPASIVGISISKQGATEMLRGSTSFEKAVDTSSAGGHFPTFWNAAHDDDAMRRIEHTVVDPRIKELCNHAQKSGWRATGSPSSTGCVICPHHGVPDTP